MFSPQQIVTIKGIHADAFKRFTYTYDSEVRPDLPDWWMPIPQDLLARGQIKGDCDDFARVCMLNLMKAGFNARLVYCMTETNEGHLICEVVDPHMNQAMYLDNRQRDAVNIAALRGYRFISVSPWNPQRGDKRPWLKVTQ